MIMWPILEAIMITIVAVVRRMMVSVVGQLVLVARAAKPDALSEGRKSISVAPIFDYHRFALLSHVAEDN